MPEAPPQVEPSFGCLQAPDAWQTVDLISDLHLQACETATFEAWRHFMATTSAQAVLILGDLFEVWVGDDAVASDPFLQECAHVLQQAAQRVHVAFMPGNRDFLVGSEFLAACGVSSLTDPTLLIFGPHKVLLSHGDALCLDDAAYQDFRLQVRQAPWQRDFLAQTLPTRLALARDMRQQSEIQKQTGMRFADADEGMSLRWLAASGAQSLVHGHTHQPADHPLGPGQRHVLSDWSLDHLPFRAEILRMHRNQAMQRLPWPSL